MSSSMEKDDIDKCGWTLGKELGSGHFAKVKKVTRKSDGQEAACKIIKKPKGACGHHAHARCSSRLSLPCERHRLVAHATAAASFRGARRAEGGTPHPCAELPALRPPTACRFEEAKDGRGGAQDPHVGGPPERRQVLRRVRDGRTQCVAAHASEPLTRRPAGIAPQRAHAHLQRAPLYPRVPTSCPTVYLFLELMEGGELFDRIVDQGARACQSLLLARRARARECGEPSRALRVPR